MSRIDPHLGLEPQHMSGEAIVGRFPFPTLLLSGALLLSGCFPLQPNSPSSTTISATDSTVFVPVGRVSKQWGGEGPPSRPTGGGAVEFTYLSARGSASQSIGAADQPIRHGGQTFSGPQQVHYDFTFRSYELVGRGRYLLGGGSGFRGRTGRSGVEALLGVSAPRLEFSASSPTRLRNPRVQGDIAMRKDRRYA